MKVIVRITKNFKTEAKPLIKKYPSLIDDLTLLEAQLTDNPRLGVSIGHNAYKIRLQIKSKGKGKSGGARIISLLETIVIGELHADEKEVTVNLLSIYDKSDTATISNKELSKLIESFYLDNE